ncbi:hypothetical protein BU17DRAFT_61161 [Hysterangium stoloniferum]|nr:hypothetical protein BU17DRAFT_61161 [Hysterangium stoloniferum]
MQRSNAHILENFPTVGGIAPTGTNPLAAPSDTALYQVTFQQFISSQAEHDAPYGSIACSRSFYGTPVEHRASDYLLTSVRGYNLPGDPAINHLFVSNPHHINGFSMPSTSTNIANTLDAQNHTIEAIHDICPTPQHHARLVSSVFGRQECSCHLRVKFRTGKVHTIKRFRCVQCNIAFTDRKNANRHVKTSNNPVECSRCGSTFSRTDYVKKHQKVSCTAQQ